MIRRVLFAGVVCVPLALSGCGKKSERVAKSEEPKEKKSSWLPEMKMPKVFEGATPEEKVRKQLAEVLKAEGEARYFNEVGDLYALSADLKWDSRRLLSEVLDYAPRATGEQQTARYLNLLNTLQAPKTVIAQVTAERLGTGSAAEEEAYRALLRVAAPPDARGTPDFSHVRPVLEVNSAQPPERLVLWMFDRDAGAALRELTAVYGRNLSRDQVAQAVWAEHVIADQVWRQEYGFAMSGAPDAGTTEQLSRMAQSPAWWMRTYAAAVMGKHPALRSAELVRRLSEDTHPIVRKAMERVRG